MYFAKSTALRAEDRAVISNLAKSTALEEDLNHGQQSSLAQRLEMTAMQHEIQELQGLESAQRSDLAGAIHFAKFGSCIPLKGALQ